MTMTTAQADIVVRNPQGRAIAVVEIGERDRLTPAVVSRVRRQWMPAFGPPPLYFLLLSPDQAFVWKGDSSHCEDEPAAAFAMEEIIARYWPSRQAGTRIRHSQLELIATLWLMDLTQAYSEQLATGPDAELARTGFIDAIHGGSVVTETGA